MTQSQCKFIGLIYQTLPHQLKVFKFKEEWGLQQMDLVHLEEVLIFKQMRLQRILFEVNNTLGSYNTIKNSVGFSTGFINNFELSGRISRIKSDGYIDRSGSNLRSYFLQGIYRDENTLVKLLNFAGHEITDQAWYGIDSATLESNRKYNMAGEFYDEEGNSLYYKDQIDNYKQDHYQLHWNQNYLGGWTSNFGLHYTYGRGFMRITM